MAGRYHTFDETAELLGLTADGVRELMEQKKLNAEIIDGVVKFGELEVRALGGGAGGVSKDKSGDDMGLVFLVGEEEEEKIEGKAYDGEDLLKAEEESLLGPDEDIMDPVALSEEQVRNAEVLGSEAVSQYGRDVAERELEKEFGAELIAEGEEMFEPSDVDVPDIKPGTYSAVVPEATIEEPPRAEVPADDEVIELETITELEPAAEAEPVVEPEPTVEEVPVEEPAVEMEPVAEEKPLEEPAPVAESEPVMEAEPVVEDIPVIDEPVVELVEPVEVVEPMDTELFEPAAAEDEGAEFTLGDSPGAAPGEPGEDIVFMEEAEALSDDEWEMAEDVEQMQEPDHLSAIPTIPDEGAQPDSVIDEGAVAEELDSLFEVETPEPVASVTENIEMAADEQLADLEPEPEPVPEAELEPEPSPEPEPVPEAELELEPQSRAEVEPEIEPQPVAEQELPAEVEELVEPTADVAEKPVVDEYEEEPVTESVADDMIVVGGAAAAVGGAAGILDEIEEELASEEVEVPEPEPVSAVADSETLETMITDSEEPAEPEPVEELAEEAQKVAEEKFGEETPKQPDEGFELFEIEEEDTGEPPEASEVIEASEVTAPVGGDDSSEDIEIFDIEEATPVPEAAKEEEVEEFEVLEEEVPLAAGEKSLEEEMAELFGDEVGEAAPDEAFAETPVADLQTTDSEFDLGMFQQDEVGEELPVGEEEFFEEIGEEVGAFQEAGAMQDDQPVDVGSVSRIRTMVQERSAPSSMVFTAMIILTLGVLAATSAFVWFASLAWK